MDFTAPTKTDPAYLTTSSGVEYYWYSPPYVGTIPGPKGHSFHLYYKADAPTTITVTVYLAVQPDGSGTPSLVSSKTHPLEAASTVTHIKIPDIIIIPETKLNGERIKLSLSTENPILIYYDSIATPSVLNAVPPPQPINSGWTSRPPTIDGAFSAGEWTNPQLELTPPAFPIHALVYFMNDANYLYISVDAADAAYGDYTEDFGDYCVLAFDVGNDGLWTKDVDTVFVIHGSGDVYHELAGIGLGSYYGHCLASDHVHAGFDGAIGFGTSPNAPTQDHRIYEIRIPLSMIGASPGDTVGFSSPSGWDSLPYDAWDGRHNVWPLFASWTDLGTWGDIVLASAPPVGGILIPVEKAEILAPWIVVALAAVALAVFAMRRKRKS